MAHEDGEGFKRVKIVDGAGDKNYIRVKQVDDTSVKNYVNVKESTEEKKDYINVQVVDYEYPKNYLRVKFVDGLGCNSYVFSDVNADSLEFDSLFTGNIKVILAAESETGIGADVLAGRQGDFTATTDLLNDPQWIQYEADVIDLSVMVDATFNGIVGRFALDDVWYDVDMGESESINPLNAPYVILTGSSLTYLGMTSDLQKQRIVEVAASLGYSGEIINKGIAGNTIAENTAYWTSQVRGQEYANKDAVCLMVTNGNDVTNGRPYSTDPATVGGTSSQLALDWIERFEEASADVGLVIPTDCSFRAYSDVNVFDLPLTEDNGSKPYNDNIFTPLIEQYAPEFYLDSEAALSNYDTTVNSYWMVTGNDGIHYETYIEHAFIEQLLLNIKRIYGNGTADVSGKTVITYPQASSAALQKDEGYTPVLAMSALVYDESANVIPHLHVEHVGCSVASTGAGSNSRVLDSDLNTNEALQAPTFCAGSSGLTSNERGASCKSLLSGLPVGQSASVTVAASRAASNSVSREANVYMNGAFVGILDAANNVPSNELSFSAIANADGEIVIEYIPVSPSGFGYMGATKYVFD